MSVYGSVNKQQQYDADHDGFSNIPRVRSFSLNPKFYFYLNPNSEINFGLSTNVDDRTGGDMQLIKGVQDDEHLFTEKNKSKRISTQLLYQSRKGIQKLSFRNSLSYFDRELQIPDYAFQGNQLAAFSEVLYGIEQENSNWQLGINHYFERFNEKNVTAEYDKSYAHQTIGAFMQNTSDISPELILESGLRYDYDFDFGSFVLPRVSLLFRPGRKITMRLGGALGYKLPTIFTEDAERLYYRNILPLSDDLAKAEKSIGGNFDFNYKTVLFDRLTFSVNQLFYLTQLKDALVLREPETDDLFFFENADGNIQSSGFETNLKFTLNDLKLFVNYALNTTKLNYDNLKGQKPLTPKHSAGAVLMYDKEDKWSVGYELYYTGWQYDESYDRKPHYLIMGLMMMRHFERFSCFLNFENFTDTKQTNFGPLVLPPYSHPSFPDIWAPTDGFVMNGGVRIRIL